MIIGNQENQCVLHLSDEPDDCASICPPRFFACLNHSSVRFDKSHDWCIPETLVCNGIPDCKPDLRYFVYVCVFEIYRLMTE